jgi:hypothetical protein
MSKVIDALASVVLVGFVWFAGLIGMTHGDGE